MPKTYRIVGAKQCMTYLFLGEEKGHSVPRSNHVVFDNGKGVMKEGVYCVFCGPKFGLTSTVEALVFGSGQHVQPNRIFGPGHGVKPHRIESSTGYQFVFSYGKLATAQITFENPSQFEVEPTRIGRAFNASEFRGIPKNLNQVAQALAAVGFRVRGPKLKGLDEFHNHSLRTIMMERGRRMFPNHPKRPIVDGVRVQLSYVVDLPGGPASGASL